MSHDCGLGSERCCLGLVMLNSSTKYLNGLFTFQNENLNKQVNEHLLEVI